MKVLFTGPSIDFGGAENYVLEVARACKAEGIGCEFLYQRLAKTSPIFDFCGAEGIRIHADPVGDSYAEPSYRTRKHRLIRRFSLYRHLLLNRPDLCFVTLPSIQHGSYFLTILARLGIRAIVVFQYVQDVYVFPDKALRAYRRAHGSNQEWVAISAQNRRLLCESFNLGSRDIRLINNGVRLAERPAGPGERQTARERICAQYGVDPSFSLFCTVAALRKQKGHEHLLRSIPAVVAVNPATHWLIVGEGDLRAGLESMAAELGISGHVTFCGHQGDVMRFLNGSDFFVFPTLYEGQPFALLEAVAAGIPCISTNASGIGEILAHRESALLCAPGDPGQLAELQLEALGNPAAMNTYGRAALGAVTDFSLETMIRQTLDLIKPAS